MPVVFDVCIVGSGPGGGIAAYALTKAGLKGALVESGRRLPQVESLMWSTLSACPRP